ncbi:MAG: hypothetical protein WC829_02075 [Hyphomicrobium sp.]|jgi:hypothetical protein
MAKISIALTSAIGNTSHDWPVLSDAQMTRFLDYLWDTYPQYEVDGITRKARTNANLVLCYQAWSTALWNGTKANVLSYERDKAAQLARAGVADLA